MSGKINLLKFITHFGVGGTERQFVYLTKGLDRSRFDLRVACMAQIGGFLPDVQSLNIPISEYKTNSLYGYQTPQGQFRLARDIRKQGIQVVHAYGFYPTVFAIPAARLARNCVSIASVRDMGVFPDHEKMRTYALKIMCGFADCVLANSYAVRGWLIEKGLRNADIRVIPNGILVPACRTALDSFPVRDELNIKHDAPVIAVVGRLTRTKGLEFFLDAAAAVVRRFPAVRFLVVGDSVVEPQYRTELENRAAALNLTNHVIFTGQRHDIESMMREITIAVSPSLTESFSNSVLEAMAAGLPIVATNVGGNPELITDGEHGIVVPPRDSAALARAMVALLESPQLGQTLAKNARNKVIKQYSLDSVLKQTEELYVGLLERRGLVPRRLEHAKALRSESAF